MHFRYRMVPDRVSPRSTFCLRNGWPTILHVHAHCQCLPKAEDGRIDDRYNLVELSTSSYPARTRRNIEESDGTVIFSVNRRLSGGTKLTLELANKLLNVAGPRESKEPGIYDWTLKMLRLFLNRTASGAGSTETAGE